MSRNDQYVSTPAPPAAALDRAVAKLRAHTDPHISYAIISHDEAAAILAKLEAGERLAEGVETTDRLRIAGAYGYVTDKVSDAIINLRMLSNAYRNQQPRFTCASCAHQWDEDTIWCPKCRNGYRNPQPVGGVE